MLKIWRLDSALFLSLAGLGLRGWSLVNIAINAELFVSPAFSLVLYTATVKAIQAQSSGSGSNGCRSYVGSVI